MNYIKNLFYFYFAERKEFQNKLDVQQKFKGVIVLLLFSWLTLFLFEVVFAIILESLDIIHKWPRTKPLYQAQSVYRACLFGLIIPVFEEIINRLWIVYSKLNLAITVSVFTGLLFFKFLTGNSTTVWYEAYSNLIWSLVIVISIFFVVYLLLGKCDSKFDVFFKKHQRLIVVFSSVLFGYLHLTRYNITLELLIFSPIVLGTYLSAGFIFGYIRVRFGFLYSCLIHILSNSTLILLKFLI